MNAFFFKKSFPKCLTDYITLLKKKLNLRGDRRGRPLGGEIRFGGLKRLMSCTSAGGPHGPPRGERCRPTPTGERARGAKITES